MIRFLFACIWQRFIIMVTDYSPTTRRGDHKEDPLKELPVSPEFDPRKAYHAVKSREGMLAFTGFELTTVSNETTEGILKISARKTPYRGDILILTFIIDADQGRTDKAQLEKHFGRLSESDVAKGLGAGFERLNLTCLDCIGDIQRWFVKELKLFYRRPVDQKKTLLERDVLPQMAATLNCRFEPLEWWPQTRPPADEEPTPAWLDKPGWKPLKSFLSWWRASTGE